jgi:hypothetical protein
VTNGFIPKFKLAQQVSLKTVSCHGPATMKAPSLRLLSLLPLLLCTLAACEQLGITDPAKKAEAKDAEGKAIGSACRQAGRALEDCYELNRSALKASIFAGWKDMNDYMTENKLETIKPEIPVARSTPAEEDTADETPPAKTNARKRALKADSGAH